MGCCPAHVTPIFKIIGPLLSVELVKLGSLSGSRDYLVCLLTGPFSRTRQTRPDPTFENAKMLPNFYVECDN